MNEREEERIISTTKTAEKAVLALFGSPRKGGNTELLLESFLRGVEAAGLGTERLRLADLDVKGCLGCHGCDETGRCVIQDGMEEVYQALERCERVVLAAPIYFYNVPSQTKAVIDRSQALWARKYLLGGKGSGGGPPASPRRKGFFISVGATRGKRLFEGTLLTVRYFFDAIDAEAAGNLLYKEMDGKGAIRDHPSALKESYEAGLRFASI